MEISELTAPRTTPADDEVVRRHQVGVWRHLRMLGAPAALAEDLTQETFMVWLRRRPEDRGDAARGAWLRGAARNLLRAARRAGRFELQVADDATIEAAWQRLAGADDGAGRLVALRECLESLAEREREVIALRYRDGRGREDCAERLGLSVEGVKTLLRRTKERLKHCIERRLRDEHA